MRAGIRRVVDKGRYLYRQGDRSSDFLWIESGLVRTFYTGHNGHELTFGFWSRGDLVGVTDQGGAARRVASAEALDDVAGLVFQWAAVEELCRTAPRFAANLIRAFSFKVRWTTMMVAQQGTEEVTVRLCQLLIALARAHGAPGQTEGQVMLPRYSQATLAAMLGCSRQWLSACLASLRAEGAVSYPRPGQIMVDLRKLSTGLASSPSLS